MHRQRQHAQRAHLVHIFFCLLQQLLVVSRSETKIEIQECSRARDLNRTQTYLVASDRFSEMRNIHEIRFILLDERCMKDVRVQYVRILHWAADPGTYIVMSRSTELRVHIQTNEFCRSNDSRFGFEFFAV